MILAIIAACEVGFWVLLAAGLIARYGFKWPRIGAALLICVPLVDLVLLAAAVIDLRSGAVAGTAHGLAAVYLGFSVAFGHQVIGSLDQKAAHRFAGRPAPVRPPKRGPGRTRHEWAQWRRAVLAWVVATVLLVAAIALVGNASRTAVLEDEIVLLSVIVVIWLLTGPVWAQFTERRTT